MDANLTQPDPNNAMTDRDREIALHLSALRSKKPENRAKAVKRLGDMQAHLDEVVAALDDPIGIVRIAAAEGLAHLEFERLTSDMLESLLAAIDDRDDRVCCAAIRTLGMLGVEVARDEIIPFLEDRNPFVVNAAITALARLGPAEIGEKLIGFLDAENPYLQSAAAYAMGTLRYAPAGPAMLERLPQLLQAGDQANPVILGNYIKALGDLRERTAIPLLIEIAQNHVGMRSKSIQALIEMNAVEAAPILAHMLADPGVRLRDSLIRLMVTAGYADAPVLLRPLLTDSNTSIRQLVLLALTQFNDQAAIKAIRTMSRQDTNPYLRAAAVDSLFILQGDEALRDLLNLAADLNTNVRRAVAENLGKMTGLSQEAQAALNTLANDPQPEVALQAQGALQKHHLTPPGQIASPPPAVRSLLPEALLPELDTLLEALQRWQDGLAGGSAPGNLSELAQLDRALTLLLTHLERAREQRLQDPE